MKDIIKPCYNTFNIRVIKPCTCLVLSVELHAKTVCSGEREGLLKMKEWQTDEQYALANERDL